MFATRNDQENLVHDHHQAAAAKPLNQGLKGFPSKPPAPKTPFRAARNDENAVAAGKSGLKTNGKAKETDLFGGKKGAGMDKAAFVTPAGPRSRAPLGMKTTNAKARAFQTPAPPSAGKSALKTVSPRLRRPKVKVHQPEPIAQEEDDESEPDIEYAPPKEVPLPDHPEPDNDFESYFGPQQTLSTLESASEKRERLAMEKADAETAARLEREDEEEGRREMARLRAELGMEPVPAKPEVQTKEARLGTVKSRSAAAALAAPTKASLAKQHTPGLAPKAPVSRKPLASKSRDPSAGNRNVSAENAAGIAASNSTVGYRKGRVMSSTLRTAGVTDKGYKGQKAQGSVAGRGRLAGKENAAAKPTMKEIDDLFARAMLSHDDDDLGELDGRPPLFDDDEELFQLKLDD
ncbi:MAG: hypothetical protein INR71_10250 [Terriglobus roseus]|nr:hypothetical protein [Terriglobus roseus]